MAITIDWQSQESWRGYDNRCRDHRWPTDAGRLDSDFNLLPLML